MTLFRQFPTRMSAGSVERSPSERDYRGASIAFRSAPAGSRKLEKFHKGYPALLHGQGFHPRPHSPSIVAAKRCPATSISSILWKGSSNSRRDWERQYSASAENFDTCVSSCAVWSILRAPQAVRAGRRESAIVSTMCGRRAPQMWWLEPEELTRRWNGRLTRPTPRKHRFDHNQFLRVYQRYAQQVLRRNVSYRKALRKALHADERVRTLDACIKVMGSRENA